MRLDLLKIKTGKHEKLVREYQDKYREERERERYRNGDVPSGINVLLPALVTIGWLIQLLRLKLCWPR